MPIGKESLSLIKNLRNFGLALGTVLLIFGIRLSLKSHNTDFLSLAALGLLFIISGLFLPFILRPIYSVFSKAARIVMEHVITKLVLMITFYCLFAPIGLAMKLLRKDLLDMAVNKRLNSYWIKRKDEVIEPRQYEKQF